MPEYVYALHDFQPEHEDEIAFSAGDRIEVIEKDDMYGDGWWQVRHSLRLNYPLLCLHRGVSHSNVSHFYRAEISLEKSAYSLKATLPQTNQSFKLPK